MHAVGTPLDETLDADGFFRTGDGGHLDDARRLFWESVKVTHTVGVPHETLGEVVVACLVPHDGATLDADEVRAFLRERLASYKVPRHVLLFSDAEIALTGSAKIKSTDLRQLAAKRLAEQA